MKAMEPFPGKLPVCTGRVRRKRSPISAPKHPQFLPQPFAEGETEAGESRAEWGAGVTPQLREPGTPARRSRASGEMLPQGKALVLIQPSSACDSTTHRAGRSRWDSGEIRPGTESKFTMNK